MKQSSLLFAAIMAAGLSLASCSSEIDEPAAGNDGKVLITAKMPSDINTRAYSTGEMATTLHYAVYDQNSKVVFTSESEEAVNPQATYNGDLTFTLALDLVKGQTYDLVFWADCGEEAPYKLDPATGNVTVDYTNIKSNEEKRDAFFCSVQDLNVTGAMNKSISLYRPFGQLNIGANDIDKAANAGIELGQVAVTVKDAYNTLNLLTGEASVAGDFKGVVKYDFNNLPEDETFPVGGHTYLAMNYVLTGSQIINGDVNQAQKETKDVKIEINDKGGKSVNTLDITAVPFRRNYRTNIYGSLLTAKLNYTITIDKDYNTGDYEGIVDVATAEDFVNAVAKGGTVRLNGDITSSAITLSDVPATIDMNGHNLSLGTRVTIGKENKLTIKGNGSEILNVRNTNGLRVEGGKLEVDGVRMVDAFNHDKFPNHVVSMIYAIGDDADVTIKNTVIVPNNIRTYAITTNANQVDKGIKITLENVKVLPSVVIACPTLFNLPVELTAKNCVFEGCNSAIILRGGTHTFENCTFTQTLAFDSNGNCTTAKEDIKNIYRPLYRNAWESGTSVPLAAITMGNQGNSYQYPTNVTLKGCTVNIPEVAKNTGDRDSSLPAIYISANSGAGLGVTFNYDNATTINGEVECAATGNITVNGEAK